MATRYYEPVIHVENRYYLSNFMYQRYSWFYLPDGAMDAVGKSLFNYDNDASSNVPLADPSTRMALYLAVSRAISGLKATPEQSFDDHADVYPGTYKTYQIATCNAAATNPSITSSLTWRTVDYGFSGFTTTKHDLGDGVSSYTAEFDYDSAFFDYSKPYRTLVDGEYGSIPSFQDMTPRLPTFPLEFAPVRMVDADWNRYLLRYQLTVNAAGFDQLIVTSIIPDKSPFPYAYPRPTLTASTESDSSTRIKVTAKPGDLLVTSTRIAIDEPLQEDRVKPRFQPRTQTTSVGAYILDKTQLNGFASDLWKDDVMETFSTKINGDATNCILSLKWFYGLRSAIPTSSRSHIVLGSVSFVAQGTKAVASSDFVEYDFGSVVVPTPTINDFRAYRAEYRLYMPFIGFIDLNPQDVVGKTLYMRYEVNITDGSAMAQVYNAKPVDGAGGSGSLIFSATCSWGYDIPLRINAVKDAALATAQIATRMATSVIGGIAAGASIGGGVGAVVGGVTGLGMGAMGTMDTPSANSGTQSYSVGSLAPNANVMDDLTAYLVVYQPQYPGSETTAQVTGKTAAVGKPSYVTGRVGSFSGYIKAAAVYATGAVPTRHGDEIIALLQSGVYI